MGNGRIGDRRVGEIAIGTREYIRCKRSRYFYTSPFTFEQPNHSMIQQRPPISRLLLLSLNLQLLFTSS